MNERTRSDRSVVRDEGAVPDAQTDHERRVADAQEDVTGEPISPSAEGSANRYTGSEPESYEDEVRAEQEGTTSSEVEKEDDEPFGKANRWYTG